eukprot:scaffold45724_cov21-Phaeocystis_antarctica.AAC.1
MQVVLVERIGAASLQRWRPGVHRAGDRVHEAAQVEALQRRAVAQRQGGRRRGRGGRGGRGGGGHRDRDEG